MVTPLRNSDATALARDGGGRFPGLQAADALLVDGGHSNQVPWRSPRPPPSCMHAQNAALTQSAQAVGQASELAQPDAADASRRQAGEAALTQELEWAAYQSLQAVVVPVRQAAVANLARTLLRVGPAAGRGPAPACPC